MAQISFDLKKTDKATGSTPFKNVIPFLNKNFRSSKSPSYDSRRTSPHTGRESSLEKVRILSESSPITVDRSEPPCAEEGESGKVQRGHGNDSRN